MSNLIEKRYAAEAVDTARRLIYQAGRLREIAEFIELNHVCGKDECEQARFDADLLRGIAEERSHTAYLSIDFADDYFRQQPRKKRKSKKTKVTTISKAA